MELEGFDLDGLQNVQPPEGWVPPEPDIKTLNSLTLNDGGIPYRSDLVTLQLTPEQLVVLKQALEHVACTTCVKFDYFYDHAMSLYDQQTYIRTMRDTVEERLDYYVKERPYTPFLKQWVKKIGKEDVRKLQDNES